MTESPYKRLTPENQCQIREIQQASRAHNRTLSAANPNRFSEEPSGIILDALSVTHATDFSSALDGYYKIFKNWGFIDNPQCKASSSSPAR
jgi:hypothetical protein